MSDRAFIDDLKTLRERAGIRIKKLATDADVSENTIRTIEKHKPVMPATASAVFNAVNDHPFFKGSLDHEKYVSARSRYGSIDDIVIKHKKKFGKGS